MQPYYGAELVAELPRKLEKLVQVISVGLEISNPCATW
jgi:hypothetical protein